MTLWLKSWDQQPAGSLPDDDVELCRLAELGRDTKRWKKLKPMALLHWEAADDGRLYHRVVTEYVTTAWNSKTARQQRTEAARAARRASSVTSPVTDNVTEDVTDPVTGSNRTELNRTERNPPYVPPHDVSLSQRGKGKASPVTTLYEGAHLAAEAVIARLEAEAGDPRNVGDRDPPPRPLLDRKRSC